MSVQIADPLSRDPGGPSVMLLVGGNDSAHQAAARLEPTGLRTVLAPNSSDALARLADVAPDLVVVGEEAAPAMSGTDVVRQIRATSSVQPPVVVIGEPDPADLTRPSDAEYLPTDVGVTELVHHIRSRLSRTPARRGHPWRAPVSEDRMLEEIDRELERAELAARPGVLAIISVAELTRLHERLGADADHAVTAAYDELLALDAEPLERHSPAPGGGIYLLMPEVGAVAAKERLHRLSLRIARERLEVSGEHLRLTPVIGYTTFSAASTGRELRDQAAIAAQDAGLHLDLLPVPFSPALAAASVAAVPARDRLLSLVERVRSPLQVGFTLALLLSLPFIVYVLVWWAGFDLTTVTYPLMAAALAGTAAALWIESFRAIGAVDAPAEFESPPPGATAVIVAYLPNEAATILDTVTTVLSQDYPGELQVILAYNTPQHLPIEETLADLASRDPRLLLLRVPGSTSKAQNINAALAHVSGEFVGVFDADHHPAPGSFLRAWRWLSNGHDIVQGHCVVRNGDASWVARLVAVEFETVYAVSHPGRARLHGFGIFGGSNGYWRRDALRQIRMQRSMLTEDIDSSMRSLREGFSIVSDPALISTELAPTTIGALWNQRMRWAQGWTQTARRHLRPALSSDQLDGRQKLGAAFLLGWAQVIPWITIQVVPILAFVAWRDGGLGNLDWLVPLFVLLSVFTFSVGAAQAIFAYLLGDDTIRRHRGWFVLYALHSILWFGEFKNLIVRTAQLKELIGERQWRVTPRSATPGRSTSRSPGQAPGDH
jgi:cellulose synthase/poly-beta-1,6-N-acetylglucosamine synthase-like glycosyltransferase/DNA-binding response OmpR family regulator